MHPGKQSHGIPPFQANLGAEEYTYLEKDTYFDKNIYLND